MLPVSGFAQDTASSGGEANLILPDLSIGTFFGVDGRNLLMVGLFICALGLLFGLLTYRQLRDLPVHKSMLEVLRTYPGKHARPTSLPRADSF